MSGYERGKLFASSRLAIALAFIWGFCEATFFFIVPDAFFALTALFLPFSGLLHGIASVAGTVAGGMVMYNFALLQPLGAVNFLLKVPGIKEKMFWEVFAGLRHNWLGALFYAPLSGIPYKIYAVEAAILGINFAQFMLMTFPSRLVRALPVFLVSSAVGKIFRKGIKKHTRVWVWVYLAFWLIFYLVYALGLALRYRKI
jgi:membrane protein YqaA with SNARE-associated domain